MSTPSYAFHVKPNDAKENTWVGSSILLFNHFPSYTFLLLEIRLVQSKGYYTIIWVMHLAEW